MLAMFGLRFAFSSVRWHMGRFKLRFCILIREGKHITGWNARCRMPSFFEVGHPFCEPFCKLVSRAYETHGPIFRLKVEIRSCQKFLKPGKAIVGYFSDLARSWHPRSVR
jgi:hypothetical protein